MMLRRDEWNEEHNQQCIEEWRDPPNLALEVEDEFVGLPIGPRGATILCWADIVKVGYEVPVRDELTRNTV